MRLWSQREEAERRRREAMIEQVVITPHVAFSLPHALFAAGLLNSPSLCDFDLMQGHILGRWPSPQESVEFWESLAPLGISRPVLAERAREFDSVLLGHWFQVHGRPLFDSSLRFCRDLAITLAVLSRVTGPIFLSAAEPCYNWDVLLRGIFCLRDSRFEGVPLSDPVWPQSVIQAERRALEEEEKRRRGPRRAMHGK